MLTSWGKNIYQRNGGIYDFLTDEERDIETEIKNTEVDQSEISEELKVLLFREVITTPKIRHISGTDYKYAQKIDGELKGQDSELSINLITPFHPNFENPETLIMVLTTDELLTICQMMYGLYRFCIQKRKVYSSNQQAGLDEVKSKY